MDALDHEARYRGAEAVAKLAAARVCLLGAGAVGSNLAETLARQGVRRLRVVDRDRVEPHNTATQVYGTEDAGALKTDALKERIFRATGVEIEGVAKELTAANARKLMKEVDLVVDGFDNSASRRAATEACAAEGWACLHVGLNADYGEVRWNERYVVPGDPEGGDVCDYPLARNLVGLVVAVAAEAAVRFLLSGAKEDYSVTLGDLRVNRELDA
jgi:molybdopterin/thiamine biosynthesis adenylyltransferase